MRYNGYNVQLTLDDDGKIIPGQNKIDYDDIEYSLDYLSSEFKSSKGGNSSVFVVKKIDEEDKIIKISNYYKPTRHSSKKDKRRYGRFIVEIDALYRAKENQFNNIIEILFDGIIEIDGYLFPYYVMEKADTDLKECFLFSNEFDLQEKFNLCVNIFNAIKQLHSLGIYHRDIKPDNIFMFDLSVEELKEKKYLWKIGDLGLISERHKDYDDLGERIGPFGWISPEAMNKYLTEKAKIDHDCIIDDKSDIFQLGELFWFIFQLNSPIGQIYNDDFFCEAENADDFFELVKSMLSHKKEKRISLDQVENKLTELQPGFEF